MRPVRAGRHQKTVVAKEETKNHKLLGGDVAAGKTSNVELDVLLQPIARDGPSRKRFLLLPAHVFPELDREHVSRMQRAIAAGKTVLFPIFIRSHWVAGVLYRFHGGDLLDIYDSAPSVVVRKELRKKILSFWPSLDIASRHCPFQKRGSDDCGLFMLASLYSIYFDVVVQDPRRVPKRLRPFCAAYMQTPYDDKVYLQRLKRLLKNEELTGGSSETPPRRTTPATESPPSSAPPPPVSWYETEFQRGERLYAKHGPTFAKNPTLRSVFVAMFLLGVADRSARALELANVTSHAGKLKLRPQQPYDVVDVLHLNGIDCVPAVGDNETESRRLVPGFQAAMRRKAVFVYKADRHAAFQLPAHVHADGLPERTFVLGARFVADDSEAGGHYQPTKSLAAAQIGVYLPKEEDTFAWPKTGRRRLGNGSFLPLLPPAPRRSTAVVPAPRVSNARGRNEEQQAPAEDSQHVEASAAPLPGINADVTEENFDPSDNAGEFIRREDRGVCSVLRVSTSSGECLNWRGGRFDEQGRTLWGNACPRNWVIHPKQPPHITQVAWRGISEAERGLHLSWLRRIRDMPASMLTLKPENALLEMLNKDAVAKKYSWTTYVRKLSIIQSALRNLPLYTNQPQEVDLSKAAVWRSACQFARKMMRQAETQPPQPLTWESLVVVQRELRRKSPAAALYVTLMWCTAARAVDIERLQIRDVLFTQPAPEATPQDSVVAEQATERTDLTRVAEELGAEMVNITVHMKRGKGAHFRGPYTVFTALPRQEAAVLAELLATRRSALRLFPHIAQLRTEALGVICRVQPGAEMPSVRKGSIRFLAEKGLTQEELMRLTGHTRLETLLRYLGDGRRPTREEGERQARVARALRQRQTAQD